MRSVQSIAASYILAILTFQSSALAQDVALAEALFSRGVSDMQAGNYEVGCPAIAESYRLDPRPGALFTLAECERKRGRIATAVAHYSDYLALFEHLTTEQQAKHAGRRKTAAEQKASLEPLVPMVTLTLPTNAPSTTVVKRDGLVLSHSACGVPLPIDPGPHLVTTQVPGGTVKEVRLTIEKGEKKRVVLDIKIPAPIMAAPTRKSSPTAATATGQKSGVQRTVAYTALATGLAGFVVSGITGGLALHKKGDIQAHCNDRKVCDHEGKLAADAAQNLGLVSTLGFVVGVSGLSASAVLWFTQTSVSNQASSRMLGVRGVW